MDFSVLPRSYMPWRASNKSQIKKPWCGANVLDFQHIIIEQIKNFTTQWWMLFSFWVVRHGSATIATTCCQLRCCAAPISARVIRIFYRWIIIYIFWQTGENKNYCVLNARNLSTTIVQMGEIRRANNRKRNRGEGGRKNETNFGLNEKKAVAII